MSQLVHRRLTLIPSRVRVSLLAGAIALLVGVAPAIAISASDGDSTGTQGRSAEAPGLRSDGGPEEGTRGIVSRPEPASHGASLRSDGGPEEGTRGVR
jgi:hypothetical protein